MKKSLLLPIFLLGLFSACRDDTPKPEPEPDEYFSFYADGVYYDYPQIIEKGIFAGSPTLKAKVISATVGYQISGRLKDFPTGLISMTIPGGHIPDQDTMTLTEVYVYDFNKGGNGYRLVSPLTGFVVFTERTYMRLTGTFEFQAYKRNYDDPDNSIYEDSILTITGGKFSIIPTN